ncbi:MAG: hypothetical protein MUF43_11860 [Flavobacterium sp.]|jgi:hypothetical protein|nr:hypothetical protein [Flavobacterium sp.]
MESKQAKELTIRIFREIESATSIEELEQIKNIEKLKLNRMDEKNILN